MSAPPVLVVQHEANCPPGHLGGWARTVGVRLDVRECHHGQPLPETLTDFSGLVVLGGDMGAYDDARYPWLTTTKSLIIQSLVHSVPFFGICLGHQLAAAALGGRVAPAVSPARGVRRLVAADACRDDPIFGPAHPEIDVFQWNSDVVTVEPVGAAVLARDARGETAILRFGERSWGIQGHPEVPSAVAATWGHASAHGTAPGDPGREPPAAPIPSSPSPAEAAAELAAREVEIAGRWRTVLARYFSLTLQTASGGSGRAVVPLTPPAPGRPGTNVPHR